MMNRHKQVAVMMLACSVLLAAGCSRSPRTNFYMLSALAPAEVSAPLPLTPSITVGSVTLPEFVDRPQLVMVNGDNRVEIMETHQWAESLKSAIPRIIADNLSRQLGTDRVTAYPQHAGTDADFKVIIDFQRFETTADSVTIDALWTLRTPDNKSFSGRSRVRETCKEGIDTVAAAYSRALASVSKDIAVPLKKQVRP